MRGSEVAGLVLMVALLGCWSGPAGAQPRKAKRPPIELPSNLPPERPPPPPSGDEGSGPGSAARPSRSSRTILPGISNQVLMIGVAGLGVLLVVTLGLALRRRQPSPLRLPASRASRPDHPERPEPVARKRKTTLLPAGREESAPSAAPELRPEQSVLLARSGGAPSLHDTLVSLGPDPVALRCLRRAAIETLDPMTWSATVKDARTQRLSLLALTWARQVALERVASWLRVHPLVTGGGLQVQVPGSLEPSDLENLTLTQADGLGVTLGSEQNALLAQGRAALSRAFSDHPLSLLSASAALRALLPEELCAEIERGHPPHALPLLVCGMPALDWAAKAGLSRPNLGSELREALREHAKLVGTPVPAEGPAVHALEVLGGGKLDGIGMLLAAVAGAAFSSSTVILRISKRIGEIRAAPLIAALSRLGGLVTRALDDEAAPDRAVLLENLRFVVGEPLLERESKRAAALVKEAERLATRDPIWKGAVAAAQQSLDLALITVHDVQVRIALERAGQAKQRLLEIVNRLAHPGTTGEEESLGHRRLGYVMAGLGAPVLRNTSTELLSAGREALAMTAAMGAAGARR